MLYYPKMPDSRNAPSGRCLAFEKYDGTNLHFDWDADFGWHSFGTRRDEFALSDAGNELFKAAHAQLNGAAAIFLSTWANELEKILTGQGHDSFRVFTEFLGPNSFAGLHKADDPKRLVLFDVEAIPNGMLNPFAFVELFGHLPVARVVYEGKFTGKFSDDVRNGKYNVNEGVVVKGGTHANLWMVKVKTYAYMERLKQAFADKWEDHWE